MTCRSLAAFVYGRKLLWAPLLAWSAVTAPPASASVETGQWLQAQCAPAGEACINYITGVLAGTTMAMAVTSGKTGITLPAAYEVFLDICVPVDEDVTISDQIAVALDYMQRHPDELQQPAAGLVVTAQQRKWPCPAPAPAE